MNKKYVLPLLLLLALFFRYYHLLDYQYLQDDENSFLAILAKMWATGKPILVSPNATTGISLGPWWHWFSMPFFVVSGGDPVLLGVFPPLFGVVTTWLIFKAGEKLVDTAFGLTAGFLYAISFLASFFDRRFWALTPDPFAVALSLFSLVMILRGKIAYTTLLAVSTALAWNADYSLAIIPLATLVIWIVFRLPVFKKQHLPALIILLLSWAPFFIFEVRHQLVHLQTLPKLVSRFSGSEETASRLDWQLTLDNFTRLFFTAPSDRMETYLHYQATYPAPLFKGIAQVVILILVVASLWLTIRLHKRYLGILWIYAGIFIFGNVIYSTLMKATFYQHYFAVILPVFCLILALPIWHLFTSRYRPLAFTILGMFLVINLRTLLTSKITHPTYEKMNIVANLKVDLQNRQFGFYSSGIRGSGMAYPFLFHNLHPVKSNYHDVWYWIYAVYSLFDTTMQNEWPETVVLIKPTQEVRQNSYPKEEKRVSFQSITAIILDNSNHRLTSEILRSL